MVVLKFFSELQLCLRPTEEKFAKHACSRLHMSAKLESPVTEVMILYIGL